MSINFETRLKRDLIQSYAMLFSIFIILLAITFTLTLLHEQKTREDLFFNSKEATISEYFLAGDNINLQRFLDVSKASLSLKELVISAKGATCSHFVLMKKNNEHKLCYDRDYKLIFKNIFLAIIAMGIASVIIVFISTIKSAKRIRNFIQNILAAMKSFKSNENIDLKMFPELTIEEEEIITFLNDYLILKEQTTKLEKEKMDNKNESIKFHIARQVSHDIRSPLSALDMIVSSSDTLPDEERRIVKHAVRRIHDIANNLLQKSHPSFNIAEPKQVLLGPVIESIISEKRVQYRSAMNTVIKSEFSEGSLGLFVNINESELKRALSNLINNSVEAFINGKGKVSVKLNSKNSFAIIEITDDGVGIPEHVLTSITSNTPLSTKPEGNGLGLKSANEIIKNVGGSVDIQSQLYRGTTITVTLPLASMPVWYQSGVVIHSSKTIIIDDDKSIHQLWAQKLSQANFHGDVKNYTDFENEIIPNAQYLIDYEFLGKDYNGLDKIIELKIPNAILVTSHYDEEAIQDKCIKHGIKIIPKSAIPYLPIRVTLKEKVDLILLDDDELIRLSWENSAKKQNNKIACYARSSVLLNEIEQFSKDTPIYLDSELGEEIKGQDVALKLYNLGFKNLIICTGHSPDQFKNMPWLTKIQGKNFPA